MALKKSGKMYLETIYILRKSKANVHSIDVAEQMDFSRASVSWAMGLLREQDYIVMDKDGSITLTEAGNEIAGKIPEWHTVLSKMFMALGVDEKTATEDACRIEHVISDRCFEVVKQHYKHLAPTEKALAIQAEISQRIDRYMDSLFVGIPEADLAVYESVLEKMTQNVR